MGNVKVQLLALVLLMFVIQTGYTKDYKKELSAILAQHKTIQANFIQNIYQADGVLLSQSTGNLSLKKPNKFCLNINGDNEQLILVGNDNIVWHYDVLLEQVIEQRNFEDLPLYTLMSANTLEALQAYKVTKDNYSKCQDNFSCFRLQKYDSTDDSQYIVLGFSKGVLQFFYIVDSMGQKTEINLIEAQYNVLIEDKIFNFVAPNGVDVIKDDR